jgi:hypothetical protein
MKKGDNNIEAVIDMLLSACIALDRPSMFVSAAKAGNLRALKHLENYFSPSEVVIAQAIIAARENGYNEICHYLKSGRV